MRSIIRIGKTSVSGFHLFDRIAPNLTLNSVPNNVFTASLHTLEVGLLIIAYPLFLETSENHQFFNGVTVF